MKRRLNLDPPAQILWLSVIWDLRADQPLCQRSILSIAPGCQLEARHHYPEAPSQVLYRRARPVSSPCTYPCRMTTFPCIYIVPATFYAVHAVADLLRSVCLTCLVFAAQALRSANTSETPRRRPARTTRARPGKRTSGVLPGSCRRQSKCSQRMWCLIRSCRCSYRATAFIWCVCTPLYSPFLAIQSPRTARCDTTRPGIHS